MTTEKEYAVYGARMLRKELLEKLHDVNEFLSSGKKRFVKEVKVKTKRQRNPFTDRDMKRLTTYRGKGWTFKEIAEKMGRSEATLYAALRNGKKKE